MAGCPPSRVLPEPLTKTFLLDRRRSRLHKYLVPAAPKLAAMQKCFVAFCNIQPERFSTVIASKRVSPNLVGDGRSAGVIGAVYNSLTASEKSRISAKVAFGEQEKRCDARPRKKPRRPRRLVT